MVTYWQSFRSMAGARVRRLLGALMSSMIRSWEKAAAEKIRALPTSMN